MTAKRESDLARLWRHRPGRELVGMAEDVFMAKWKEGCRPLVLKWANTENGAWMMVHLPPAMTFREFEACGEAVGDYSKTAVEIRREGDCIELEMYRSEMQDTYPFEFDPAKYKKMVLPAHFGIDRSFRPAVYDLVDAPHVLIGGNTGLGKSNLLHTIAASVLVSRRAHVVIFDPKILEFAYLENYADVFTDDNSVTGGLKWLNNEMDKRLRRLKKGKVVKFQNYKEEILPVVVIIDELAELNKESQKLLYRLLRMGRAVGISVVAAIQRPSSTTFDGQKFGDIKFLFRCRVCFACDSINSGMVLDNNHATYLDEIPGRCVVQWGSEKEVQNFFLPPDDEEITAPILAQSKGVKLFGTEQLADRQGQRQADFVRSGTL